MLRLPDKYILQINSSSEWFTNSLLICWTIYSRPKESSFIQFVRTFYEFVRTPLSVPPPAHHRQLCLHPLPHLMKIVGLQNAGLCLALICHIWRGRDLYCATLELLWHRTSIHVFIRLIRRQLSREYCPDSNHLLGQCWHFVGSDVGPMSFCTTDRLNCQRLIRCWFGTLSTTRPAYANVMPTILFQVSRWANVGPTLL